MSLDHNKETRASLKREIKAIQTKCENTIQIIQNEMSEVPSTPENTAIKVNSFVEGLRTEIHNSNTAFSTDDNLLTSQFLFELTKKTEQAEELLAFTRGKIYDTNAEIKRMQALIDIANEAKAKPISINGNVEAKHVQKAKEQFQTMKVTLQGLIKSLFPHCHERIIEVLGDLMRAKLEDNPNGYINRTEDNYQLINLLKDMVIMTYINITSVKLFVKVQNIFGVFKVFACLIVIGGGIYEIAKGNTANLDKGFEGSNTNPGSIALALYSGLWAYDGWNSVTVVTEEIINPAVNLPLSISIAVPVITALYVFMNVAYMTVLSYTDMVSVPAVAVAFGAKVLGPASFLIPLGVAISTFGCAMSVQFGVTRVCYTAARGGHMLELFSFVNVKRMTPAPAVAFQCLLTTIFIAVGNIQTLIEFASWFLWFFYGLAMVALLVLRKTNKKPRPYRVPTPVPCFVLLVAIFLSVLPIVHDPSMKYLIAIGFIVVGVAVYTVFVYYKKTPTALLEKITLWTQLLFESVPPSHQD